MGEGFLTASKPVVGATILPTGIQSPIPEDRKKGVISGSGISLETTPSCVIGIVMQARAQSNTNVYCPHTHTHTHLHAFSSMVLLIQSAGILLNVPAQLPGGCRETQCITHSYKTIAFSSSEGCLAFNSDYTAQNKFCVTLWNIYIPVQNFGFF